MQRILGGALVVLVLLMAWLWPHSAGVDSAQPIDVDAIEGAREDDMTFGRGSDPNAFGTRRDELGTVAQPSAPATYEAVELHAEALRAQLEAIARAEQRVTLEAQAGHVSDEAQRALEAALAPLLFEPSHLYRALDMLRSGELAIAVVGADGAGEDGAGEDGAGEDGAGVDGFSLAEFGAVRAFYWALLAYTAPESDLNQAGAGVPPAELLEDVLTALPDLRHRVQRLLLTQLTEARLDGVLILDRSALATILYLRSQFPEQRELFSALLANIGESMAPDERDAVFSVLLDEDADPTLVGVALTNLLRGDGGSATLRVAEALYDSSEGGANASARRREAIAKAVAASAKDPYEAARFLADRSEQTRNMLEAYWTLGERDGGLEAVEAQYFELTSVDANPRARLSLVLAMSQAPPERLLEIIDRDSDASVRGQAVLTLTSADGYVPRQEHVDLLRSRRDGALALPTNHLVGAAANIASHARQAGREEIARDALELLQTIGADEGASERDRKRITEVLKTHLDPAALALWLAKARELDGG